MRVARGVDGRVRFVDLQRSPNSSWTKSRGDRTGEPCSIDVPDSNRKPIQDGAADGRLNGN